MNTEEYEDVTSTMAIYPGEGTTLGLTYTALGLAGEAGEFADKVKKVLRDANGEIDPPRRFAMLQELGDVAWYLAACARELNSTLGEVMEQNATKLLSRRDRDVLNGDGDYR